MNTKTTTYRLSATYYALRPFECEGTLEEIAEIVTASDGEIIHLDDSHYGPGQSWEEPATGYTGPGWYYKVLRIDESFTKADSLESAIREVASHDTMTFSLEAIISGWTNEERRNALLNNDLGWYLVDYSDGRTDLVHATALSNILQCGEPMEAHGISKMQQCWNGEDLGE